MTKVMGLSVLNTNEALAALVKQLPVKLRTGINTDALRVAIAEHVIGITSDGKLEWLLQSKTLLAHFCGRMWCGDVVLHNMKKRTYTWKLGERDFPEKDLEDLFGQKGLRNLRRQRELCAPPSGFEMIEKVFSMLNS